MSGHMNNVEIEDVLSSIRRLVSEETRSTPPKVPSRAEDVVVKGPLAAGAATAEALADLRAMPSRTVVMPDSSDKLLLSPAFRVPDVSAANSPEASLVPRADLASLEATIAELEAAVGATPGAFESDGGADPYPQAGVLGGETTPLASDEASLESEAERMARVPAFVSRNSPRAVRVSDAEHAVDTGAAVRITDSQAGDRAFDPARFDAVAFDYAAAQLRVSHEPTPDDTAQGNLSVDEMAELEADRTFAAAADAIVASSEDFSNDAPEAAIDDAVVMTDDDLDEAGFEVVETAPAQIRSEAEVLSFADHAAALRAPGTPDLLSTDSAAPAEVESQDTAFDSLTDEFTVAEADFADHADVETRDVHFEETAAEAEVLYAVKSNADAGVAAAFVANDNEDQEPAIGLVEEAVHPSEASAHLPKEDTADKSSDSGNGFSHKHDAFTWRTPDPAIVGAATATGVLGTIAAGASSESTAPSVDGRGGLHIEDDVRAAVPIEVTQELSHQPDGFGSNQVSDELAGADDFSVFEVEESVIDEAALRDLIATIIREELQGALGERITRNVRKLVRTEIQQALAARDAD